ncbi:amino acid permease [Clostridium thailandense]|uniref:amino acid permease n=1 Tax=Clostridium thailandense TaxID=2794346 RepID=UPI0039891C87
MSEKNDVFNEGLERGLEERHIQLMSIGGAIGVGLFLGSAGAIKTASPSLLLTYAIGGVALFFILRALGEMAVEHPVSGSFSAYAAKYRGPLAGYLTGWTYWFNWVATCMAEVTAVGIYIKFWFPNIPQWITALSAIVLMTLVNLIAVKAFGEFEFWFALIKVVTIVVMIIIGLLMISFGLGNGGKPIGISNLWSHGGFFPMDIKGTLSTLVMVAFAFGGIELIGVTAGEAKNPDKTIPAAINKVLYRILIFYIGALFVIMSLYPWNQLETIGSPFVMTFNRLGIAAAAGIINFVVLTTALSSCNSGIFTTGRMLYNLSLQGSAPKAFGKLSKNQVPMNGILASSFVMLIGVVLNYVAPGKVFVIVASISNFGSIFTWLMIMYCHNGSRKNLTPEQIKKLKFPLIAYPFTSYIGTGFLILVLVIMCFNPDTLVAIIVGPIWLLALVGGYYGFGLNNKLKVNADDI